PEQWDESYRPMAQHVAQAALAMSGEQPEKGVVVNGSLVSPTTGKVIASVPKEATPEKTETLGAEAAAIYGLKPGKYSPAELEAAKTKYTQGQENARAAAGRAAKGVTDATDVNALADSLLAGNLSSTDLGRSSNKQAILAAAVKKEPNFTT